MRADTDARVWASSIGSTTIYTNPALQALMGRRQLLLGGAA